MYFVHSYSSNLAGLSYRGGELGHGEMLLYGVNTMKYCTYFPAILHTHIHTLVHARLITFTKYVRRSLTQGVKTIM